MALQHFRTNAAIIFSAALLLILLQAPPASAQCRFLLDNCGDVPRSDSEPQPAPRSPSPPDEPPSDPDEPETPSRSAVTYWDHNGSVMRLKVDGRLREFYYHKPRAGIAAEGAKRGTLLFSGTVQGGMITGTAWLFSRRCGPRSYQVYGAVEEDGGKVTMSGAASKIDGDCNVSTVLSDTLTFKYLYSE